MQGVYESVSEALAAFALGTQHSPKPFKVQLLADETYHKIMYQVCLTIVETKGLVKFQEGFLAGRLVFVSLVHAQIVEFFKVLVSLVQVRLAFSRSPIVFFRGRWSRGAPTRRRGKGAEGRPKKRRRTRRTRKMTWRVDAWWGATAGA